jgi:hypothetical protein
VNDAFICQVIGIEEQGLPVGWEGAVVHSEAVILRSDVTLRRLEINARLVHPSGGLETTGREGGRKEGLRGTCFQISFCKFSHPRQGLRAGFLERVRLERAGGGDISPRQIPKIGLGDSRLMAHWWR